MQDNLFFEVLSTERQNEINAIKRNKAFALKLVNDLDKVFYTNFKIEDDQESVVIYMKANASYNLYGAFTFTATKNGINFRSKSLGYYKGTQFKNLGELYEKYKDTGTTADTGFLSDGKQPHGHVQFVIPINEGSQELSQTLRDIIYLMEQNQYKKRF